jgi:hypothetical protein
MAASEWPGKVIPVPKTFTQFFIATFDYSSLISLFAMN